MNSRSTVVAIAVLAAVVAWIWFVEIRGATKKESAEKAEKRVFDVAPGDVTAFTVEKAGVAVTCERPPAVAATAAESAGTEGAAAPEGKSAWKVTAPVATEADSFAPDDVVRSLVEAEKKSVVNKDAPEASLPGYGLDAPELKVRFQATESRSGELWIGRKNPIAETQYARRADAPEVFLVDAFTVSGLSKDLFALRDKKVLDIEDAEVTGIDIDCQGIKSRVRKVDGLFRVVSPFEDLAGEEAMRTLVGSLRFLEATRFEEPGTRPASDFGLEAPFARLTIEQGTAFAPQTLLVGSKPPGEEAAYVRRAEGSSVAVVPSTILADVQKNGTDLREHHVFPFDRYALRSIEVVQGGSGMRLERSDDPGAGGGGWRVRPVDGGNPGEAVAADAAKADEYLRSVADLEARGYLDSAPDGVAFGEAATMVRVDVGDDQAVRIFRVAAAPGGEKLYVKDERRPVVLELPADAKGRLMKAPPDFAPAAAPAEAEPAGVEG